MYDVDSLTEQVAHIFVSQCSGHGGAEPQTTAGAANSSSRRRQTACWRRPFFPHERGACLRSYVSVSLFFLLRKVVGLALLSFVHRHDGGGATGVARSAEVGSPSAPFPSYPLPLSTSCALCLVPSNTRFLLFIHCFPSPLTCLLFVFRFCALLFPHSRDPRIAHRHCGLLPPPPVTLALSLFSPPVC